MNRYGLYADDAETQIRRSHKHRYSVTAHPVDAEPFTLAAESCQVIFDEAWSIHIQATITTKVPEDQALLDSLDARKGCRITIDAGYIYDGGIQDIHLLADLHLRDREVNRPDNTLKLVAFSDEARAADYRYITGSQPNRNGVNELLAGVLPYYLRPDTPEIVSDFPDGYGSSALSDLIFERGLSGSEVIADVMNRCGVWIHCTSDRKWRVTKRAELSGATALQLTVGADGTLTQSATALSRENWFNTVCLRYWWDNGADEQNIYGVARIMEGEFGVNTVGHKVYYEERNLGINELRAHDAAVTLLRNLSTRGRSITLSSIAAYWLRAGDTVTVKLPTGEQERHLVQQVAFDLNNGSMSVVTRLPENVIITAGGE